MQHRNLLALTAALLAYTPTRRGEGTEPPRYTEQEWQDKRAAELAKTNQEELVKKVVALEVQNQQLKGTQVPQGARVLNADEAKDYDAYVALGKPDEVKKGLEEGTTAKTSVAERAKADAVDAAATAAGFKKTVLGDRLKADGLTDPTVREVERGGKKVQVAYVKDAQGAEHELGEYAKKNWGDYLPALQVTPGKTTAAGTTEMTTQDTTTADDGGASWVKSSLATAAKGGGYVDPLQPQAAAPAAK